MPKHTIRLTAVWEYDDEARLGKEGGFGDVFRGTGGSGPVAVKRLKLHASHAASRELSIGDYLSKKKTLKHVVPVLDAGRDADSDRYFLVMPVCDRDLQAEIHASPGGIAPNAAVAIIRAILSGLHEVQEITHRDLKPPNILLYEGAWKIADFGIAKFVEDATSLQTLRRLRTPAYAAPEQWLEERPTSATDIYAVGCIAYALLTGHPPFNVPRDQLKHHHLHSTPERLPVSPPMDAFLLRMLGKEPEARPTLQRCIDVFRQIAADQAAGAPSKAGGLVAAASEVAEREVRAEAKRRAAETQRSQRARMRKEGWAALGPLRDRLFKEMRDRAEAKIDAGKLTFGNVALSLDPDPSGECPDQSSGKSPDCIPKEWDLLIASVLTLAQSPYGKIPRRKFFVSLFFGRLDPAASYRWYELGISLRANTVGPTRMARDYDNQPELVDCRLIRDGWREIREGRSDRDEWLSMAAEIAYGPRPIDVEDEQKFIDRWAGLVGLAATKGLEPQDLK